MGAFYQHLAYFRILLYQVIASGIVILVALIAHRIVFKVAGRISRRTASTFDDSLLHHSERPARAIFPIVFLLAYSPALNLSALAAERFRHILGLGLIASIGWLLVSLLYVLEDIFSVRYRTDVADNLRARRIQTQVSVIRRILYVVIVTVTLAIMLMTFPSVRHLGESLFASAGIAALVAGLAARPTFSSLIAGLQIALTEPIRLDDVVVVEGEWGRIEEITTTYVAVRIWDERRLIVPLSKFIEEPFQNWTRRTSNLLGTVFLYVDYTAPVDELRAELHRILAGSKMWDGKVWGMQVTNASEHTVEIRCLMSSADSSLSWDLRCEVREKMIGYLQQRYPGSLPRTRAEVSEAAG
jgi:small-conductance mechanosensitive channel